MGAEGPVRLNLRYPAKIRVDEEIELRLVDEGDAAEIFSLTDRNREYLRRWLPWVDGTRSEADTRTFIDRALEQVRMGQGFHARIDYRGQLAGILGFVYLDPGNRRAELGYWVSEALQGRGIMTRACRTLADFAFGSLGLNRVEIRVEVENRRSRGVPERLGFVPEGVLREAAWVNGRYVDLVMYAMLRSGWPPPSAQGSAKALHGEGAVPAPKE